MTVDEFKELFQEQLERMNDDGAELEDYKFYMLKIRELPPHNGIVELDFEAYTAIDFELIRMKYADIALWQIVTINGYRKNGIFPYCDKIEPTE